MTAAQASLPPAPDETLRRWQGLGRAASLSAEGRRRGRLRGADGAAPVTGSGACSPLQQAISGEERRAGSWPARV